MQGDIGSKTVRGTERRGQGMEGMGWSVTGMEVPETLLALCSASPVSDPAQGLPEALDSFWGTG